MLKDVDRDDRGRVTASVSDYQPSDKVKERTARVLDDFFTGHNILKKPRREFSERSVITYMNDSQKAFNSYVPPRSDDPDESWRAQTIRPITRNKLISIAAHMTASIMYPSVFAQTDTDDEDKDSAHVMKSLLEWVIDNSNYVRENFYGVISSLVNPVWIMKTEYAEVMRTVRKMAENGEMTEKEIVDEIFSGFQFNNISPDEFFIANFYESNLQKQRFVGTRRWVQWSDAHAMYHHHENFKYVKPGLQTVFIPEQGMFFDQKDDALEGELVEEFVYYNRLNDLKLTYLNGVLMEDPNNPNPRLDKMYPFASTYFEPLGDGKCFYGKSAADKIGPDQDLVDTLYNMIMDGTFLQLMPPMAHIGEEEIDSSVMVPGTITNLSGEDASLDSIAPNSNLNSGINALQLAERSITESTQSEIQQGIPQSGEQTAQEMQILQQNARVNLGLFTKMNKFLVEDLGKLMTGDIIQHMTTGQVMDTLGPEMNLKFRTFLVPDKPFEGRRVTEQIQFTDETNPDEKQTKEQQKKKSFDILEEEGGLDSEKKLYKVNPSIFRKRKYKITITNDDLTPKNENLEKAMNLEAYDRMIQNPILDQEAVTRDFLLETYKPGESNKYVRQQNQASQIEQLMERRQGQEGSGQRGVNQNVTSQVSGQNSLKSMLAREGGREGNT